MGLFRTRVVDSPESCSIIHRSQEPAREFPLGGEDMSRITVRLLFVALAFAVLPDGLAQTPTGT